VSRPEALAVILVARQAEILKRQMSPEQRAEWDSHFEDLIVELKAAQISMRHEPLPQEPWIPPYLRSERQAAFHE
jgi:hypothetical protein